MNTSTETGMLHAAPTPLRTAAWGTTFIVGVLQVWADRFYISPDGNNYLDIASAYLRHDWSSAVNGWWSPMLSWILCAPLYLGLPGRLEATALHILNLGALLISLLCYEFLVRELRRYCATIGVPLTTSFWALAYSLFVSTSVFVLGVKDTTPDGWVAATVFVASALLIRIREGDLRYMTFALLGVLLGIGYLFKMFFFPLSFVVFATAWTSGARKKTVPRVVVAMCLFALVAGPFVLALSSVKHRLTFGDTGRLAYFAFMSRMPQPVFWHGEDNTGIPRHPIRQLMTKPRLYEFGSPLNASYPPYYDQSYWLDGAVTHFRLSSQLAVLRQSAGTWYAIWAKQVAFAGGLIALIISLDAPSTYFRALARLWFLWTPSLVACVAYSLVLTEGRYVAPFLLVLWTAAFAAAQGFALEERRRVMAGVVMAVCVITLVDTTKAAELSALRSLPEEQQNVDWDVARGLQQIGIISGDRVAGISIMGKAHWARLAGVRIVAEIPLGDESFFWNADADTAHQVMEAFRAAGARAIVTQPSKCVSKSGWIPLPETDYYVYMLR